MPPHDPLDDLRFDRNVGLPKEAFYITTAIDYANGDPHIGHALEKIGADVIARYQRLAGKEVHFVIGMDEHGLKVLQSAQEAEITPQEWVDDIAERFLDLWEVLDISYDDFIRTSQQRHHEAVHEIVRRVMQNGDLYQDKYQGFYCVGCESYKTEDELIPAHPGDSDDGLRCPIHPSRKVEWMEEDNWFFRLTAYRDALQAHIDENPPFIMPRARRNEVRGMLEIGFQDISVSRAHLPWGVEWPDDPNHTVYVWMDALTNYLSAIGFPDPAYLKKWPADVHVIGKDITRFHCVYWPAFLMSAGIELPRQVWAHGFVTYGGQKLSKSEGKQVSLPEWVDRHGPESLRYYLMREVPWDGDGGITEERFDAIYTAELANDLGNLANRAIAMIEKYRDGLIPEGEPDPRWADRIVEVHDDFANFMDRNLLHKALEVSMKLVGEANGYIEERQPWAQAKDPDQASGLDETLLTLARILAVTATLLSPFMPKKMAELAGRMGLEHVERMQECHHVTLAGRKVHRGAPLFPRADLA
jgi:methionyl-tRNA synthetase